MIAARLADRWAYYPQQMVVLVVLLVVVASAFTLRGRSIWRRSPVGVLTGIVALDFGSSLWASLPYLPIGIDEAYYVINAHVYLGEDLYYQYYRPPLPGLGAALAIWHPPLVGLLFKQGATILSFVCARRPLGDGAALLAALLSAAGSRLAEHSVQVLGGPYEAFFVLAFTLLAARRQWLPAALAAGLGFVVRWHIGALLPLAVLAALLSQRELARRLGAALLAVLAFSLPALILVPLTDSDPFRSFQYNTGWEGTPFSRLLAYLEPKISLGLTVPTLLLVIVALGSLARRRTRQPELVWAGLVFATYVCAVLSIGTIMPNYFIPHTAVASVLVAAGCVVVGANWRRRWLAGLLTALVVVYSAMPVKPPKVRARKLANPAHAVHADLANFRAVLGAEPLYSDMEFLTVTAVLARPVHAVIWEKSEHHGGVAFDWEGKFPDVTRRDLPKGVLYLTIDPAGRAPLWTGAGFALVRW